MNPFCTRNRWYSPGATSYGPHTDTRSSFRNISSMVKFRSRFDPGSTRNDVGWMSSDAGIQLMVCASATDAPDAQPVVFTTVAQVCVYFARFGVDCEPNTRMKYRSPGGAVIAVASRSEIEAAGVGGFSARVAQPLLATHARIGTTSRIG